MINATTHYLRDTEKQVELSTPEEKGVVSKKRHNWRSCYDI